MTARPKGHYVRSEALREAYRKIPCQHCGADDGTVCCAHSNMAAHGKGKSIKASDDCAASLCSICHFQLDQGFMWTASQKVSIFMAAWRNTINELVVRGLWPAGIPVPTPWQ